MSNKGSSYQERDEEIRMRVYTNASTEMQAILKQLGGTIVSKRFEKVFSYYNSIPKTTNFPLNIVELLKSLSDGEESLHLDLVEKAYYLNWCYQVLCYAHLILDDLVDNSQTRYGKQCWHRRSDVGLSSVFDALLLDKSLVHLVNKKCERKIVDVLLENLFYLEVGQTLNDMLSKNETDNFTRKMYEKMIRLQNSAFLSMPMMIAMSFMAITDQIIVDQVKNITSKAEILYQIMNDYQDLYGDAEKIGKDESDIQQRKCTWFAFKCLEKANVQQKQVFKQNYGFDDPDRVSKIKELYSILQLKKEYIECKNHLCMEIESDISRISHEQLRNTLFAVYIKIANSKVDEINF